MMVLQKWFEWHPPTSRILECQQSSNSFALFFKPSTLFPHCACAGRFRSPIQLHSVCRLVTAQSSQHSSTIVTQNTLIINTVRHKLAQQKHPQTFTSFNRSLNLNTLRRKAFAFQELPAGLWLQFWTVSWKW